MKKNNLKNRLSFQFLSVFIGVLILLLALLGLFSVSFITNEIKAIQSKNLELTSQLLAEKIYNEISMVEKILEVSSKNKVFLDTTLNKGTQESQILLKEIDSTIENSEAVYLLNKNGVEVGDSMSVYIGTDLSARNYFKEGIKLREKSYITPQVYKSVTRDPVITIVYPISFQGETTGLLCVALNLKKLGDKTVNSIQAGQSGYSYLLDENYKFIVHKKESNIFKGMDEINPLLYEELSSHKESHYSLSYMSSSKIKKVASFYSLANQGIPWTVATIIEEKEVTGASQRFILFLSFLGTLFLILLTCFVALYFRNRISQRLLRLKDVMEKASKGDMKEQLDDQGGDEVSLIVQSYSTLRKSLDSYFNGLYSSLES